MKIDEIHKIHVQKIQDVFFLRVPNRRRQATTSRTARGDLKTGKISHLLVRTNFGDEIDIFSNTHTHIFHVAIRHLHAQAHITPVDSESYNFKKRQERQQR